ncbi:6-phosphogluconolactonase [Flavobacterium cyanobacteriorum]|uniref:6-phosphogluconolactonase n=2 Tax=Flavobacterium cyanobacteriorum TaxID=2022802 RepID=A0A255ZQZ4_9FLAO|nr:6-phosphogluconolactonase [Flavobacterium cyanobacteriorum]
MKIIALVILFVFMHAGAQDYNLVVGTYTRACDSKGLYVYDFNSATAETKLKSTSEFINNPSYLTASPDNKYIYTVNENGEKSGVTALRYTPGNGKLKSLHDKDSRGEDPCYIISNEKHVIVANYTGGTISVFERNADGSLTDAKQLVKHSGRSINNERQEKPHIHMVQFSPDKKYVFAIDLGTDKIYIYHYNPNEENKILVLKDVIVTKAGSGPRHMVFNPNGIFFYVLHELDASLTVYSWIKDKAMPIQELSIAIKDEGCKNSGGDLRFTRDGKFLYVTNRGDANTVTIFKSHANGMLNFVEELPTMGEEPRNISIDPKDNFVLIGHQKSNDIVIFKRDKTTGKLTDTTKRIRLCSPVCLIFTNNK